MKNRILILTITSIIIVPLLFSCSNKEKLTIVDNIVLGETKQEYQKSLKTLKTLNNDFYTEWLLMRPDDIIKQKINFFYTNQFNYDEFIDKANSIEHLGVFVPEFLNNKNLTSFKILLGHTNKAIKLGDSLKKGKYIQFRQDISKEIIQKIKELYILKYGEPIPIIKPPKYTEYYLLFENSVQKNSFLSTNNSLLKWETEYYTITFFLGLDLNAYYIPGKGYSQSTNRLYSNLDEEPISGNQQPCFSVPYIKYELNSKGIELLGLKNINL